MSTKSAKKECDITDTADYVIVGAGAGGSVLAARLVLGGKSVILIEAGPDTSYDTKDPLAQIDLFGIQSDAYNFTIMNRFYVADSTQCGSWHATQTLLDYVSFDQQPPNYPSSFPEPGQKIYYVYPRACGAGGCTSHHACVDGAGSMQIYENISKLVGDSAWNGDNVWNKFKEMESTTYPEDPAVPRGKDGWLTISHPDYNYIAVDAGKQPNYPRPATKATKAADLSTATKLEVTSTAGFGDKNPNPIVGDGVSIPLPDIDGGVLVVETDLGLQTVRYLSKDDKTNTFTVNPGSQGKVAVGALVRLANNFGLVSEDGKLVAGQPMFANVAAQIAETFTDAPFQQTYGPYTCYGPINLDIQFIPNVDPYTSIIRGYAYQNLLVEQAQKKNPKLLKVVFNSLASEIVLEKKDKVECGKKYKATGVKVYSKAHIQEVQTGNQFKVVSNVDSEGNIIDTNFNSETNPYGDTSCTALTADNRLPSVQDVYHAKKEVIVCGGSIQSPQLLMLSGIGPKSHLSSVGIETKVNLPGVGTDLTDHVEINQVFEMDPKKWMPSYVAGWLIDPVYGFGPEYYLKGGPYGDPTSDEGKEYVDFYNNTLLPLSTVAPLNPYSNDLTSPFFWDYFADGKVPGPNGIAPGAKFPQPDYHNVFYGGIYYNWDDYGIVGPNAPGQYFNFPHGNYVSDYENPIALPGLPIKLDIMNAQFPAKGSCPNHDLPRNGLRSFLTSEIENMKPIVTNGTIRLASNDPRKAPIIDLKLYEDDAGCRRLAKAMLQTREVMNSSKIRDAYGLKDKPFEIFPGENLKTEDQLTQYVKTWFAYGHHIGGTCQMGKVDSKSGKRTNPNTVVDSKLRVVGVECLRVADVSVFPGKLEGTDTGANLHAFNTSRGGYLVGQMCADFILCEH